MTHNPFMKIACTFVALSILVLAGCSTSQPARAHRKPGQVPKDTPETVLVTYHVKAGMEAVFEHLLSEAWNTYRKEHLVLSEPHVVVREGEENNTVGYVEIFTWVSHAAPGHASSDVQQIWSQEHGLCEARGGRQPLGGGEVELLVPGPK
jgi:hypothetical protein